MNSPRVKSSKPTTSATSTVPATTTMTAVITTIDPSKPMVAICFDDGAVGSSSDSTSMRISTDKENEVKYAYSKGMEIANHSTSHPDLTTKSASEIRSEYDTTQQKLRDIIGAEPAALMRLPYFACNSAVQSALSDVSLITCSIDTQDWNGATSNQIIARIKAAMNDGSLDNSIVLCHETYASTAEAIEYLAPYLKEQGWQIVTVSEAFRG